MINEKADLVRNFSFWYCEYLRRNPEFLADLREFYQLTKQVYDRNDKVTIDRIFRAFLINFENLSRSPYGFELDPYKYFEKLYGYVFGEQVISDFKLIRDFFFASVEKFGGLYIYNKPISSDKLLDFALKESDKSVPILMQSENSQELVYLIRSYEL